MNQIIDKTQGWKTLSMIGLIVALSALSLIFEIELPVLNTVVNQATDSEMMIVSLIMAALRWVTTGPVGFRK